MQYSAGTESILKAMSVFLRCFSRGYAQRPIDYKLVAICGSTVTER